MLLATAAPWPLSASAQVEPVAPPRSYVCYKLGVNESIAIDGRLTEPAWAAVGWSEPFMDISGPLFPTPYFDTFFKARYDDTYLYIGGYLQETQVWAYQTEENSVVFNDNDFEVFIDPAGDDMQYKVRQTSTTCSHTRAHSLLLPTTASVFVFLGGGCSLSRKLLIAGPSSGRHAHPHNTHATQEFEINAINVSWHLTLTKPYKAGGVPYNNTLPGLKTAVYVDGPLNNPAAGPDAYWSVELALPLAAYLANETCSQQVPPASGTIWRINFSRVEWNVTDIDNKWVKNESIPCSNWVWSPQW